MELISKIDIIRNYIKKVKNDGKSIGFVPTMGYLHEGHASLIRESRNQNDVTIVSIFVNPTQFGPSEDFDKYPRDLERDKITAQKAGADMIFYPDVEEMYPAGYSTYVNVEKITDVLCGKTRPGHFKGVATIVCKFFNILTPDRAYFGEKDAQQVAVIMKMVTDLNIHIEMVKCPIVREEDGLAMSSRNAYLKPDERKAATILNIALREAEASIKNGEASADKVIDKLKGKICSEKLAKIDYVEVLDSFSLEKVNQINDPVLIAVAVWIGRTRLIDNISITSGSINMF